MFLVVTVVKTDHILGWKIHVDIIKYKEGLIIYEL